MVEDDTCGGPGVLNHATAKRIEDRRAAMVPRDARVMKTPAKAMSTGGEEGEGEEWVANEIHRSRGNVSTGITPLVAKLTIYS